jgi:hypothetical protein
MKIDIPPKFGIYEALRNIQRGEDDPTNIIDGYTLRRALHINHHPSIIEINCNKNQIIVKSLNKSLNNDERLHVINLVTQVFGLDDPMIRNTSFKNDLEPVMGVHGFFSALMRNEWVR